MTDSALSYEERFPEAFRQSFGRRFGPAMLLIGLALNLVNAVWFFDLPNVIRQAHWERTGLYLSEWISYDVKSEFRLSATGITPKYPKFSPLGPDPHPDWVLQNADGTVTVLVDGSGRSVTFSPTQAMVANNGETARLQLGGDLPHLIGAAPDWLQNNDDSFTADLGFAGQVRLENDRVKVSRRFLGWPNFIFDTSSRFFGKSTGWR